MFWKINIPRTTNIEFFFKEWERSWICLMWTFDRQIWNLPHKPKFCCHHGLETTKSPGPVNKQSKSREQWRISLFISKPRDLKFGMHVVKPMFYSRRPAYYKYHTFLIWMCLKTFFFMYVVIHFGPKRGLLPVYEIITTNYISRSENPKNLTKRCKIFH